MKRKILFSLWVKSVYPPVDYSIHMCEAWHTYVHILSIYFQIFLTCSILSDFTCIRTCFIHGCDSTRLFDVDKRIMSIKYRYNKVLTLRIYRTLLLIIQQIYTCHIFLQWSVFYNDSVFIILLDNCCKILKF